jgi:hypothetical protein
LEDPTEGFFHNRFFFFVSSHAALKTVQEEAMRLVNAAQRFVNVFAAVQSNAVVVMSNAMRYLLDLPRALLGTSSKHLGKSPTKRSWHWLDESICEIGICKIANCRPAYAIIRRRSSTSQISR